MKTANYRKFNMKYANNELSLSDYKKLSNMGIIKDYMDYRKRLTYLNYNVDIKRNEKGETEPIPVKDLRNFLADYPGADFMKSTHIADTRAAGTIFADKVAGYNSAADERMFNFLNNDQVKADFNNKGLIFNEQWRDREFYMKNRVNIIIAMKGIYSRQEIDNIFSPEEEIIQTN